MTGGSILIVENERVLAEDLKITLEEMGYRVCSTVGSGEAAVDRITRGDVGFVLMDIRLDGEMDGIDAAERIRAMSDVPVVYLTAHSDADCLARAKRTAPYGYLLKPIRYGQLRAVIEMAQARFDHEAGGRERPGRMAPASAGMAETAPLAVMCACCKQIRDPKGHWKAVEHYIAAHCQVRLSHSICPTCARSQYPEYDIYP